MTGANERYPPRLAAIVVFKTFDWESRKADYRSFVEEYRDRYDHCGAASAKLWAYRTAARSIWEVLHPDVRGAAVTLLIRLIIRN